MRPPIVLALLALLAACFLPAAAAAEGGDPLKILLIDGQNNHRWQETTPVLVEILEDTGRFEVEVATSPPAGEDLANFNPSLDDVDAVISNYNGDLWGEAFREAFTSYVAGGGGFVAVHAANNSFPQWGAPTTR